MSLIVLLTIISQCLGANILVMMPFSVKSHVNTFMPLFQTLADRGHNITMVSSHGNHIVRPNWINIPCKHPMENLMNSGIQEFKKKVKEIVYQSNKGSWTNKMYSIILELSELYLKEGLLQNLVDENTHYDLMISETLTVHENLIVFSHIYGIPVINIDPHFPSYWACFLTGNVCPSSYIPNYKSSFSDEMNFMERIENSIMNLKEILVSYFYYIPKQEELIRKYFKHPKIESLPPLVSLIRNSSLTLVDSHFTQSYPRPYLPNIVEVGGLTFKTNTTLDKDIEKFINESENGVIYFSFGSALPTSMCPEEIIEAFTTAFKSLKQNIIMKWEEDELPNKSKNVMTLKWAPQAGILAHPNCLMFISHGGIHSVTESINHGVPLLIIPFISDQEFNAKFAEKNGIARVINKHKVTSEGILTGIKELLTNPSYKSNALKRSRILKDKPLSPLDTAVYWVEYVLRHNGAPHLRPSSINMSVYEYIMLDFGAIFVLICAVLLAIIYLCITFILNKLFKH